MKRFGKYRRKVSWIVKRFEKYGKKVGWIVKWFGKCTGKKYGKMKSFITSCTRTVGWIVKWYGKYRRKVSSLSRPSSHCGGTK